MSDVETGDATETHLADDLLVEKWRLGHTH
jgi:hypothetical protein